MLHDKKNGGTTAADKGYVVCTLEGEPLSQRHAVYTKGDAVYHYVCTENLYERFWSRDDPKRYSLFDMVAYRIGAGSWSEWIDSPYWHALILNVRHCCPTKAQCAVQYYVAARYREAYAEDPEEDIYERTNNSKHTRLAKRTTQGWLLNKKRPKLPPCAVKGFRWLEFGDRHRAEVLGPPCASLWLFDSPRYPNDTLLRVHGTQGRLSVVVRDHLTDQWRERCLFRYCPQPGVIYMEVVAFWPWPFSFPLPPGSNPELDDSDPDKLAKYKIIIMIDGRFAFDTFEKGVKGHRVTVRDIDEKDRILDEISGWTRWICVLDHLVWADNAWGPKVIEEEEEKSEVIRPFPTFLAEEEFDDRGNWKRWRPGWERAAAAAASAGGKE